MHARARRITPAYAGKSSRPLRPPECRKDHPRVCGEKQKKSPTGLVTRGSPPHVRGKGADEQGVGGVAGITPAYAGKRVRCSQQALPCTDHPRMCGEKSATYSPFSHKIGSPPHVRGKDFDGDIGSIHIRITPACAGKRRCKAAFCAWFWDHPRMCGEKYLRIAVFVLLLGSPPHVRGKASFFGCSRPGDGITPACAGKSSPTHEQRSCSWDHPRMCGEKRDVSLLAHLPPGSPPHVRGKARLQSKEEP